MVHELTLNVILKHFYKYICVFKNVLKTKQCLNFKYQKITYNTKQLDSQLYVIIYNYEMVLT